MQGRCQCGQIRFETGRVLQVVNCHCSLCRGMNGTAFSSYAITKEKDFCLQAGSEKLSVFQATERAAKHFCSACGTPMYNTNPVAYPGLRMVYLGTLEGHQNLPQGIHIFCADRLIWTDEVTAAVRFDGAPEVN